MRFCDTGVPRCHDLVSPKRLIAFLFIESECHIMTYPWVNQRLSGRINGEVEKIISSIANPYARYWGLNNEERENVRNIIEQLLPTSEVKCHR